MSRFLGFLVVLFIILFVVQQSHLFEETKVFDQRLGVSTEQYRFNWDNLVNYLGEIPEKIKEMFSKNSHHRHR